MGDFLPFYTVDGVLEGRIFEWFAISSSSRPHFVQWRRRWQRRDKKSFLSEECKETEENNRIRKTRDHFKKIGDTKGTFHSRIHTVKVRNVKNLVEATEVKKRPHEYTEKLNKEVLMTWVTTMCSLT